MNKKAAGSTKKKVLLIDSALYYAKIGFSVIPIRQNKKPFVGWTKWQSEPASPAQIREWWSKWPMANPAVVTGAVSGITVVDCDSLAGKDALSEFLPDTLEMPIAKTPHGWHFFFKYQEGISNGVRVLNDCDVRNDGGYIILPPSQNGNGKKYAWELGLKITDIKPAAMPDMLFDILQQGGGPPDGQASSREQLKKVQSLYKKTSSYSRRQHSSKSGGDNNRQQPTTNDNISFEKGSRDDTLFRLANHLVKGGMPRATIQKYLIFFASHCNPPFPEKEIHAKIESAFKRSKKRDGGLTQEIRDLILTTSGNISTTFVYNRQQVTTREDKKKVAVILSRLEKEGLIERTGRFAGEYRIVEKACDPEDWQHACTNTLDLWLPFELGEIVEIMPGDIVLIAGSQNSGKSALMMNIAKENRHAYNVHYFSSELRPGSFNRRMSKFPDVSTDQLKNINFYQRSSNFGDVIKTGAGNLNILDYIEMHDKFYMVSEILSQLHDKLDGALLVAAIQKDPKSLYGRGGSFTQEKPVLSISLDQSVATISKCKEWQEGQENPNGKQYNFKIVDGCRLKRAMGWHKPQIE